VAPPSRLGLKELRIVVGFVVVWIVILGVAVSRSWQTGDAANDAGEPVALPTTSTTALIEPPTSTLPRIDRDLFGPVRTFGEVGEPQEVPGGHDVDGDWVDSPRFGGGYVLVPDVNGVVALDPATATVVWRNETCPYGLWASHLSGDAAPAVVLFCDGELTGIAVADGQQLWRIPMPEETQHLRTGPTLLVLQTPFAVTAIDLVTGVERGRWEGLGEVAVTSNRDTVFVAGRDGVQAFDATTGAQRWVAAHPGWGVGATDADVVVRTVERNVVNLDAATGAVRWVSEDEFQRLDWADVTAITDDAVMLQAVIGVTYLTVYDRATGEKRWEFDPTKGAVTRFGLGPELMVTSDVTNVETVVRDVASGEIVSELVLEAVDAPGASSGRWVAVLSADAAAGLRLRIVAFA
jgi:outer membrane protein assembly factor BamB